MLKVLGIASTFIVVFAAAAFAVPSGSSAPVPATDTLPIGTVLMLDALPQPVPGGWAPCGYIRVEKGKDESGIKADHDYVCLQKLR